MEEFFPDNFEAAASDEIDFFIEEIDFEVPQAEATKAWIRQIIAERDCQLTGLTYVFCDDAYLHQINLEYLNHDTFTDIITFPFELPPLIEGEIYISVDRVRENAATFQRPFAEELRRVIIHGVLHLSGQLDKTEAEAAEMRRLEAWALAQFPTVNPTK